MDLLFKENFETTQHRYMAWWNRQEMDGPLLGIFAPRDKQLGNAKKPPPPASVQQQWLDLDYRLAVGEHELQTTCYGGDALPTFDLQFGPGSLALHLGSPAELSPSTVWYHPIWDDITAPEPRFNHEEAFWKLTVEFSRRAMEQFRGRALVTFPDIIENLDIVASLRGTQPLLLDLIDHPQHVHRHLKAVNQHFFTAYDALEQIIRDPDGGTAFVAFQIWSYGRTCKIQSDISAMLSPAMFDEFAVPYFVEQCRKLDTVLYHLDGPDAIKHVDSVCALPINAVQWQPGAGKPNCGHPTWFGLLQRILDKGKGVMCWGTPVELVQPLVEALGPRGLMIVTHVKSEQEARDLYKASKTWRKRS